MPHAVTLTCVDKKLRQIDKQAHRGKQIGYASLHISLSWGRLHRAHSQVKARFSLRSPLRSCKENYCCPHNVIWSIRGLMADTDNQFIEFSLAALDVVFALHDPVLFASTRLQFQVASILISPIGDSKSSSHSECRQNRK